MPFFLHIFYGYSWHLHGSLFRLLISFVGVIIVHYGFYGNESDFWTNVLLAIFGSGFLTTISSFVGYFYEKRKAMENFWHSTCRILRFLNKYESDWDIEKKIDFYLVYCPVDI